MTNPDSPALDLDALTALEQAATPAPWEAHMVQPNMAGNHQWYLHPVPRRPAGVHATGRGEDIDLIVAMRNALPALLSALTAARGERDHYLRSFKAQQAENERVHAKVREQYDVIEHAKKQRDEAIEQAKQAQAALAAVRRQAFWLLGFYHIDHCESRDDAAAVSACPDSRCAEAARALNLLPAAAPDPATVLRSGPCATANCAHCTRDDCGCSCHDVTHTAPVPAGGEDGSGTADGNREVPA